MFTEFLLIDSWAFWVVIAFVIILEAALLTTDKYHGLATFLATAALLGIIFFTDAFKGARIVWLIFILILYVALGVAWAFKKWYTFVTEARDQLRESYNRAKPGDLTFEQYTVGKRPLAIANKQRIVSWMVLWPFSFSWWAMTWPRRAFAWLYERLSTVFDRISDRIFAEK